MTFVSLFAVRLIALVVGDLGKLEGGSAAHPQGRNEVKEGGASRPCAVDTLRYDSKDDGQVFSWDC